MKKALISSVEPTASGFRVVHTSNEPDIFEVHESLFWVDCADDIVTNMVYYDPTSSSIVPIVVEQYKAEPLTIDTVYTIPVIAM